MATNKNYAIALKPITTVNGEIPAGTILVMENDPGGWSFMKEPVLKYALAIKDLNERLKFGQSAEQQSFILQLKVGDHVKVPNGSFTFNNKNFLRGYVKHKVYVNELGPGLHFVVASSKPHGVPCPPIIRNMIMPDSIEVDWNHCVIVSAEHVFNHNAKECPNVELFHAYVGGSDHDTGMSANRQSELGRKRRGATGKDNSNPKTLNGENGKAAIDISNQSRPTQGTKSSTPSDHKGIPSSTVTSSLKHDPVAANKVFGYPESTIVQEIVPPLNLNSLQELKAIIGDGKGIQGHACSSYLDVILFALFTFSQCFDSLLYRSAEPKDIKEYDQIRAILRNEIAHPLRKHHFVRADKVVKLRELLKNVDSLIGLTDKENDPEDFLNILMAQTLKAEPLLKFDSGLDGFCYQLFVEKNDDLEFPHVQQIFDESFKTANIKLRQVPSCFIIQVPRSGKNYKLYPRIVPSLVLDITDIVSGHPPACRIDGRLAILRCTDCNENYCRECFSKLHINQNQDHKTTKIRSDFPTLRQHQRVPRIRMDLFSVICTGRCHYASFVKAGDVPDAPWLFFDRRGGPNGYSVPSIVPVPDLPEWLSEEGARKLHNSTPQDKCLPPLAKRLLCDAHICIYVRRDATIFNRRHAD